MWVLLLYNILRIYAQEITTTTRPTSTEETEITYSVEEISEISYTEAHELRKLYRPEWDDLDTCPLPQWYDVAKIGIFIHWGVYSVPCYKNEWFWYMWRQGDTEIQQFIENERYNGTYEGFAPLFTAELFEPDKWAELFAKAGAKYVVLTTKHHDGFALFPSGIPDWNAVEMGPKKDLVEMLSVSVRKYDIKFGVYYSLYEWYNKLWLSDKHSNFSTYKFVDEIVLPDIKQLIIDYKPSVLWLDGDWEATYDYWKATDLLAWIYNESPVKDEIVVNDRFGAGMRCHHGDFYNCDDRFNPRQLMLHKWENAFTLDFTSWSFRRNMMPPDVMTIDQLLEAVVSTVSCGGNALINIGPTKEGTIVPIFLERLAQLGEWLEINGEAIYDTSPWYYQSDTQNKHVWYTCKKKAFDPWRPVDLPTKNDTILAVYVIFFQWPSNNVLTVADLVYYMRHQNYSVNILRGESYTLLNYVITSDSVAVNLPSMTNMTSRFAWVLKISL